jgi:hypothetical protein
LPKPYCNAVGCQERRIRPDSTHCRVHDKEWKAIQREQKIEFTPALKARRIAMGMMPTPRA